MNLVINMHNNPNISKDKVNRKIYLWSFFLLYSLHKFEVETTTKVDLLFSELGTELWDLNGGEKNRDGIFWSNLTFRFFFYGKKCYLFIFVILNYKINSYIFQTKSPFIFA